MPKLMVDISNENLNKKIEIYQANRSISTKQEAMLQMIEEFCLTKEIKLMFGVTKDGKGSYSK